MNRLSVLRLGRAGAGLMSRWLLVGVLSVGMLAGAALISSWGQPGISLAQEEPAPEEADVEEVILPDVQPLPAGDFRLVFRESFLLEQLETQVLPYISGFSAGDLFVENPAIDLRPDNVIDISADTELALGDNILPLRPTISMSIAAEENRISLTIEAVTVQGVRLPAALLASQLQPLQDLAEEQINFALTQAADVASLELVRIETTEDLIALDFNFGFQFFVTGE